MVYHIWPTLKNPIELLLQSLTTWDSGNQLTYPVKYIDIGYKDDLPKEDEAKETGFLHVETSKDSDIIDLQQNDQESN